LIELGLGHYRMSEPIDGESPAVPDEPPDLSGLPAVSGQLLQLER